MKWLELVSEIEGEKIIAEESISDIDFPVFDSRLVNSPEKVLFVAIKSAKNDGHNYALEMYDRGCRNFILSSKFDTSKLSGANILRVDDTIEALQKIASKHRHTFKGEVIGITGSNGKTIVKEWLSLILGGKFHITKSPKSYNSKIGVPISVLGLNSKTELSVFEAGISTKGEMAILEGIIKPTIGIFTNIGTSHDSGFESREEKIREKLELFKEVKHLIYRLDHTEIQEQIVRKSIKQGVSWSTETEDADYFYSVTRNEITLHLQGSKIQFSLPFDITIWVENSLHVITACHLLGLGSDEIQAGLNLLKSVPMRLEVKEGVNGCQVVDDSYTNDLQALEVALQFLSQNGSHQKRTLVLSDLEGSHQDDYNKISAMVKSYGVDRFIGIGESIKKVNSVKDSTFYEDVNMLINDDPKFSDEFILVKGSRRFHLEEVVKMLENKSHQTKLKVNLEAITHNLSVYQSMLDPKTKVMAMVKAFGYGGGSSEVAKMLQLHKVDYLAVAYTDEAISLREQNIKIPIMVMNSVISDHGRLIKYQLEPEVYSLHFLRTLAELGAPMQIHLKLETGMNRLGLDGEELATAITILENSSLAVKSIFTHLASAEQEGDDNFTEIQIEKFERNYNLIIERLKIHPTKHVLNSSGIVRWPQYQFDMVRLGIGMYGYDPTGQLNLRAVSSFTSSISQIKTVSSKQTVGYNRSGVIHEKTSIATIAVGYADGYNRKLGNGIGKVQINGHLVPTVGNICMDMLMVDVTQIPCKIGDEVTLFADNPKLQDVAEWSETIPYEILTGIGSRVKRVYYSE